MAPREKPPKRAADRAFTATFALIASTVACTIVVLVAPRPVEPRELPALRLDRELVAAQRERDQILARQAATGPDIERFYALYHAEGRAELSARTDLAALAARRAALSVAARDVFTRVGEPGVRALQAAITERAMRALRGELPTEQADGLLGSFPSLLARYGFVGESGALRAPELAVRAFYKARFNLISERSREADLSPIELQALDGFNALESATLAPEQRARAARVFHANGGQDGAEALGIWLYQGGSTSEALNLLRSAYERTGSLRLRNMALFVARP